MIKYWYNKWSLKFYEMYVNEKSIEVLFVEYNFNLDVYGRLYEIINIDYAPLILMQCYESIKDDMDLLRLLFDWFKGKCKWRDKLDLLHKYQDFTHMSDKRIHLLCVLLNRQINKLRNLIENK